MNRSGQTTIFLLMLGIVVIILAMAFAPVLKTFVDDARSNSTDTNLGLNCGDITNDWQRGQCFISDTIMPYFIFGMIGIGLAIIGAKIIS
jgi:hypothetical protein